MAKQFEALTDDHRAFIAAQHLFFVGSAAETGRVNVSPKGMDSLRVMGPNRILWRNLTGSGNETAGHLARVNRITLSMSQMRDLAAELRDRGHDVVVMTPSQSSPDLASVATEATDTATAGRGDAAHRRGRDGTRLRPSWVAQHAQP